MKTVEQTALSGILIILLTLCMAVGVWGADNSFCMGCHQDETLSKQDAKGKKVSLYVSEKEYKESVHAGLSCTDCHTRIKDDAHAAGGQKIKEQQIIVRTPGADGSVTETMSVRRPTLADQSHLGPATQISQTVCTGKCDGK